jgi:hypothetical protein
MLVEGVVQFSGVAPGRGICGFSGSGLGCWISSSSSFFFSRPSSRVLSHGQPRQRVSRRPVRDVGRNDSNNILSRAAVKDWAATDAVDGNAVNQVSIPTVKPGTHGAREETERIGFNSREPHPADLHSDLLHPVTWKERYERLWEFKNILHPENQR